MRVDLYTIIPYNSRMVKTDKKEFMVGSLEKTTVEEKQGLIGKIDAKSAVDAEHCSCHCACDCICICDCDSSSANLYGDNKGNLYANEQYSQEKQYKM